MQRSVTHHSPRSTLRFISEPLSRTPELSDSDPPEGKDQLRQQRSGERFYDQYELRTGSSNRTDNYRFHPNAGWRYALGGTVPAEETWALSDAVRGVALSV